MESRPVTNTPSMSAVAIGAFLSFVTPQTLSISSTIGNIIINVVAEERKRLMTKFATSSIATVHQGLRLASLLVRNQTDTRFATPLCMRQPASMKVNSRKMRVPLPKVAANI